MTKPQPCPTYDLTRFEDAQHSSYDAALQEIESGSKRSHWMWFIFPQVTGLGYSETAVYFAIGSLEEAQAYLAHPILGDRLREITTAMNGAAESDPVAILGATDAAKFRSSMTLFRLIAPDEKCFGLALSKFFGGQLDQKTVRRVEMWRKLVCGSAA